MLGRGAQGPTCMPGLLYYRCSARCCLSPRRLAIRCPLMQITRGLRVKSRRSAVTQTFPISGLRVTFRAHTLHLAKLPLQVQRFRAAGSALPSVVAQRLSVARKSGPYTPRHADKT